MDMKAIIGQQSQKPGELTIHEMLGKSVIMPDDPRHGTLSMYTNHKCRCPKCRRANSNETFKRKYGITANDRDRMLMEEQGGKCKSCGTDQPGSKLGWAIDHCHESGRVRGILCHGCNVALGLMKEDHERIRKLADYAQWVC